MSQRRRAHLAPHDRMLRKFQYSDALSAALRTGRAEVRNIVLREGGGGWNQRTPKTGKRKQDWSLFHFS